ncbi:membrane hypothetical protein [Burkholderiales bacterium]|nr:membrane hypothetical protein [Burkholderiales bacterium]
MNGFANFRPLAGRALLGVAIALAGALIAERWGGAVVQWLLPAMHSVLQGLLPEFRIDFLDLSKVTGQANLRTQVLLMRPFWIGRHLVEPPVLATAQLTLGAFWQPIAVAIASAAALGGGRGKAPVCAALAAAAAGVLATALSVALAPTMLAGMMIGKIYWHEASEQIIPHIVRLPRFLEEGGWLMLGLVVGALIAAAVTTCIGSAGAGAESFAARQSARV